MSLFYSKIYIYRFDDLARGAFIIYIYIIVLKLNNFITVEQYQL